MNKARNKGMNKARNNKGTLPFSHYKGGLHNFFGNGAE